jgi:acetyl-CoA carboxylase biotin carboxyl carrier protein
MSNEEIRELLQIFNESGVGELELQRGQDRLRIRRSGEGLSSFSFAPGSGSVPPGNEPAASAPSYAAAPAPATPASDRGKPVEPDSSHVLVKSPIVGTFYDAPSPGAAPFVKAGDTVEVGQVLCIIESMKLMNEIEAEVAGVIAAKLVENGRPVEYGEALFAIQPR